MRLLSLLSLIILMVPTLATLAAQVSHDARRGIETAAILQARDESTNTTTTAKPTSDTETTATAITTANTAANSSSTPTPSTTKTAASTTISSLNASNTSNTSDAHKPTGSPEPGELPLKPSLTPALGVGGFILIIIGAVLALIGIRNLWVQVFISASLLTSLGVTVLIIYVMSPPVSNAVQGAYLVAVFFSGITFGALAIVFKELTEGLGCLLGGFCASMWLLCLKPGGLLTEASLKGGFIAAISVGFYALSFSHYTRPHGLILCTAISGGTAVSLGIDCFSRAGLKEFWLYVWELNDKIFPLNTDTYPITRNVRVELAVTVVVALLGIVSQLRLWKIIRQRRRNEAKLREEQRKEKDEAETEAGRHLEETTARERMEWEAKYGNGAGKPVSTSEVEDEKDGQDVDLEKGESVQAKSIAASSPQSYRCSDCRERGDNTSTVASKAADDNRSISKHESHEQLPNQDPTVEIELPAPVFDGATATRISDDNQSEVSAVIGSEVGTMFSKRFSGKTTLQRDSGGSSMMLVSQSREALARIGDDDAASNTSKEGIIDSRRSSVDSRNDAVKRDSQRLGVGEAKPAAEGSKPTIKNDTEQDKKQESDQTQGSTHEGALKEQEQKPLEQQKATDSGEKDVATVEVKQRAEPFISVLDKSLEPLSYETDDKPQVQNDSEEHSSVVPDQNAEKSTKTPQKSGIDASHIEGQDAKPFVEPKSETESTKSKRSEERKSSSQNDQTKARAKKEKATLNEKTVKHLPERASRVVQSYRTNEWAKHLDDAEIPEPPPIQPIEEEQPVIVIPVKNEEPPAPVKVSELLKTPLNAQPPPVVERRVSTMELRNSTRISHESIQRQADAPVHRSRSMVNRPQPQQTQPGSPPPKKPKWKGPPPLLAVREDLVRSRVSSTSLSIDPWFSRTSPRQSTFGPLSPTSPTSTTSPTLILPTPVEGDDVPLSQRRAMLQQQHQTASPLSPPPPKPRGLSPQAPPQRTRSTVSDNNAEAVMAAWRHSVREDLLEKRDPLGMNSNPTSPTSPTSPMSPVERRSSYFGSQTPRNNSAVNPHIENAIAEGMQRGDMNDLHREAMRRMQASATRRK